MDWSDWIPAVAVPIIITGIFYFTPEALKSLIDRLIGYRFDRQIEVLRAELRKSEETFLHQLRTKDSEIAAIREGALTGLAGRQAHLDRRRIEAVEKLWAAVVEFRTLLPLASIMSAINFENAAKTSIGDREQQAAFQRFFKPFGIEKFKSNNAALERPFVSALAWSIYSAYQAILLQAVAQAHILQFGLDPKMIDETGARTLAKTIVPNWASYIDSYGVNAMPLLAEIEAKLLDELNNIIKGKESDKDSIERAAEILKLATEIQLKNTNDSDQPLPEIRS